MRLIDAYVLSEYIKEEIKQDRSDDFKIRNIQRIIEDMPTAYDPEKVVAELEEISEIYCKEYCKKEGSLYLQDAIKIVRKGGVE